VNARQLEQITEARRLCKSGEALERFRAADVSLAEVAKASSGAFSTTAVWRYVNGQRTPRPAQALALARILARLES
jgi:hypothetical protein